MRASLIPLGDGSPIEIVKEITIIGRKEFCDVRLDDPSVSKVHILIVKTDGLLLFRDMGSTNGTKVNGQRVIRGALLPNDKLNIAACRYQVQLLPDETPVEHVIADDSTPGAVQSPVVRIFRAQDLANRPSLPEDPSPRVQLDHALMVETDEESQAARAAPPDLFQNVTPHRVLDNHAGDSAHQLAD